MRGHPGQRVIQTTANGAGERPQRTLDLRGVRWSRRRHPVHHPGDLGAQFVDAGTGAPGLISRRSRHGRKRPVGDPSHERVVIDPAGGGDHHVTGAEDASVECAEGGGIECPDRFPGSDHRPGEWIVTERRGRSQFAGGVLGVIGTTGQLVQNHVTFDLDVLG